MSSSDNGLHSFDGFQFDPRRRELKRGDESFLVSRKAAALLELLILRQGQFVSKDEIFERVWPDTFVEDGVLTQNIYSLRKLLGTRESGEQIIENKTRLGYRFNSTVTKVEASPAEHLTMPKMKGRLGKRVMIGSAIFAAILAISGYALYSRYVTATAPAKPVSLLFRPVTSTGDITSPAISPDGDFAAFARDKSLFLKDIKSNKEIKLDIPGVSAFSSVQFSADGGSLLFRPQMVMRTDANILATSRLGGEVRLVAEKTWGSFGISSDGTKVAFGRNHPTETAQTLVIKNMTTGEESTVARIQFPEIFLHNCSPVWSPDDKTIAFVAQNYMARQTALYLVNIESGAKTEVKAANLKQFEQIGFMQDGRTLIASASEGGRFYHLWKITPGQPEALRLTNGLTNFGEISFARNGTVLALQTTESPSIFIADAKDLNKQHPLKTGRSDFAGQTGLEWIDEDELLYSAYSAENPMSNLFRSRISTQQTKALTSNREFHSDAPTSAADGRDIFFTSSETPFLNLRRIDAEGGAKQTVTNGTDGYRIFSQITPDGRYLYYIFRSLGGGDVIRRDLADNSEVVVVSRTVANPVGKLSLSPDGTRVAFINWGDTIRTENDEATFRLGVASVTDPKDLRFFDVKLLIAALQMSPDNLALDYPSFDGNTSLLLRQPLTGGPPKELLRIPGRRLYNFAWSKQGKQLALSHGVQQRDAVLLSGF
ncbi:MAG: winged helix-turn-helix domain-containing protein [Acidobacteria bacterium]|nr:winged helix-turn-helix domain-containing protein [Acidobacteriota bacterium]